MTLFTPLAWIGAIRPKIRLRTSLAQCHKGACRRGTSHRHVHLAGTGVDHFVSAWPCMAPLAGRVPRPSRSVTRKAYATNAPIRQTPIVPNRAVGGYYRPGSCAADSRRVTSTRRAAHIIPSTQYPNPPAYQSPKQLRVSGKAD